jgi:hypothetical protein
MSVLDALLRVLRPGGAPCITTAFDAELAVHGFRPEDAPAEVGVLRSLAAAGPLGVDVLVACLAAPGMDRKRVTRAVEALVAAGHVRRAQGHVALEPRWQDRFARFARLEGAEGRPEPPVTVPELDWSAALAHLATRARPVDGPALVAGLAGPSGWAANGADARALARRLETTPVEVVVLLGWLVPRLGHPGLTALVRHGLRRVEAASLAALGEAPSGPQALDASLFTCLTDFADVLEPAVLDAQPDRREELLRRWCWFLDVAIPRETFPASVSRLVALDYRRALADLEAAAISREAMEVHARLLQEERVRRKAAAEAYTSGRRE